jgi:hypothetical protein
VSIPVSERGLRLRIDDTATEEPAIEDDERPLCVTPSGLSVSVRFRTVSNTGRNHARAAYGNHVT